MHLKIYTIFLKDKVCLDVACLFFVASIPVSYPLHGPSGWLKEGREEKKGISYVSRPQLNLTLCY